MMSNGRDGETCSPLRPGGFRATRVFFSYQPRKVRLGLAQTDAPSEKPLAEKEGYALLLHMRTMFFRNPGTRHSLGIKGGCSPPRSRS